MRKKRKKKKPDGEKFAAFLRSSFSLSLFCSKKKHRKERTWTLTPCGCTFAPIG